MKILIELRLIRLFDNSNSNILKKIGFIESVKYFFQNFFSILKKNFSFEVKREKSSWILVAIISLFFTGNPILKNYFGIYWEQVSGIDREGEERFSKKPLFIIEKGDYKGIDIIRKAIFLDILEYDYDWENKYGWEYPEDVKYKELTEEDKQIWQDLDIGKKGYVFYEAAIIEGFKGTYAYRDGFSYYLVCLAFFALEKIINVIMYFLIPFIFIYFISIFKKT